MVESCEILNGVIYNFNWKT